MIIEREIAACRYQIAREELMVASPQMWGLVIELCNKVPDRILVEHVWLFGKDKPC